MAASDFEIVFLLLGLVLILIKTTHVVMRKLDLPEVLGEVTLGFILGPTLLGLYWLKDEPTSLLSNFAFLKLDREALDASGIILSFISEFAVLILLFVVGTEIDFNILKKVKKPAFYSAIGGIIVPLLMGISFLAIVASIDRDLVIPSGVTFVDTALFMAVALTATSIGISTRIFLDLGKIRSKVAQTVVGAAIFDDIISVTALALVVAYVSGALSSSGVGLIFAQIAAFFLFSFLLFKYIVPWLVSRTQVVKDQSFVIFFSISFMLLMSVLAQTLSLAPIIGAFMAGVIVGNEDDFLDIHHDIEPMANWVVPFFFITIGLRVNLAPVLSPVTILLGLSLAILAISAKFIGGSLGSRLSGYDKNSSRSIGLSMAAKGEVTLIFAVTAFELGFFTLPLYAAVISLVMIDSLVVPTLLKIAVERWVILEDTSNPEITPSQNVTAEELATTQVPRS